MVEHACGGLGPLRTLFCRAPGDPGGRVAASWEDGAVASAKARALCAPRAARSSYPAAALTADSLIPADARGVIVTRTERLWLHPEGYVLAEVRPGLVADLDDAIANVAAVGELAQGKRRAVLLDMRAHATSATRECREYYAGAQAQEVNLAVAMLVRSNISRILGNFFLGLNKTRFPFRIFSDVDDALAWLRSFSPPEAL